MILNDIFYLIFITFLPGIELRGSIPVGFALGYEPLLVFSLCTLANIILIPFVFLFLDYVFPLFQRFSVIDKIVRRIQKKTAKYVDTCGVLGLAAFVAIPLPGSGAYSGALAAYVFGIERKRAYLAIALGVIVAGIIVTLALTGAIEAFRFFLSLS